MNVRRLLVLAVLAVGVSCSHSATAPKPITPPDSTPVDTTPKLKDPTVLVRNHTPERAYFYWQSGTTIFGADTIAGFATKCETFTAAADSAYWLLATDTTTYGWAMATTNYFDPTTRPAWTADINGTAPSNPAIVQRDTTAECTP